MKHGVAFLIGLLVTGTASAQSPRYTNADLGKPFTWKSPPPSAEQLRVLETNQFRLPREFDGPNVVFVSSASSAYDPPQRAGWWTPPMQLDPYWQAPVLVPAYGYSPWSYGFHGQRTRSNRPHARDAHPAAVRPPSAPPVHIVAGSPVTAGAVRR